MSQKFNFLEKVLLIYKIMFASYIISINLIWSKYVKCLRRNFTSTVWVFYFIHCFFHLHLLFLCILIKYLRRRKKINSHIYYNNTNNKIHNSVFLFFSNFKANKTEKKIKNNLAKLIISKLNSYKRLVTNLSLSKLILIWIISWSKAT